MAEPIDDTILDVADRLLPWVVPSFLVVVFALGGPTVDVTANDEWMQLVALPVLLLAGTALLLDPPRARLTRAAMLAALAIACVPLLQLLPLPSSLWGMPDARAAVAVDIGPHRIDAHAGAHAGGVWPEAGGGTSPAPSVSTSTPSSVTATMCSHWAESLRSLVTTVQPSGSTLV